ncbi:hypothetical protein PC9H_006307 [Pleurotus ostreatus]|uniref:Uncharacterized protein n=1 Tax=Pleurotus ostreatus TaxID=5322 RepID=A0A8H6ZTJ3_PLEOS|nr:uncharacterized protein PC9H_006307 [Pleurotus ostreatus]KAF7430599.1 hypothetical protein PC9H_006307 [Pleurotus ostreatus]
MRQRSTQSPTKQRAVPVKAEQTRKLIRKAKPSFVPEADSTRVTITINFPDGSSFYLSSLREVIGVSDMF